MSDETGTEAPLLATPVSLEAADLITITIPKHLSREAHERLKERLRGLFGPLRVLVLEEGVTLEVHRPLPQEIRHELHEVRELLNELSVERRRRRKG